MGGGEEVGKQGARLGAGKVGARLVAVREQGGQGSDWDHGSGPDLRGRGRAVGARWGTGGRRGKLGNK